VTPAGSEDSKLVAGTRALLSRETVKGDGDLTLHSKTAAQRRRPVFVAPHKVGAVRSPRFEVLRCLHFFNTTRI
jgi:hypothetical protein